MISTTCFEKTLHDLKASINLIPFPMFQKIKVRELKPTIISLHLID